MVLGLLLALGSSMALAAEREPGLEPQCWTEPRIVHGPAVWRTDALPELRFETVARAQAPANTRWHGLGFGPVDTDPAPPGSGFRYAQTREGARHLLWLDSEQPLLWRLAVEQALSLRVQPVNEKLLLLRVDWGRIAMTDALIDASSGRIVWQEDATDAEIEFSQSREGCAQPGARGCACPEWLH